MRWFIQRNYNRTYIRKMIDTYSHDRYNRDVRNASVYLTGENKEMGERLSWDKIVEKFPNNYVYLMDVEYSDGPGLGIESAIVVYASDTFDNPYVSKALSGEVEEFYTTPDCKFQMGALTL